MNDAATLASLFLIAFGAASLLPMQSEPLLVALLLASAVPAWLLVAVASLGNTLGALLNYALGRGIERLRDRRWFPARADALARAQAWYARWGYWSLFLSWAPVIGDPLTVVAGVMRERLWRFLIIVSIAKTSRYLVLALLTLGLW